MAIFHSFYGSVISHGIYISHIFFIHSAVYGHLGCFHGLAIVNCAAMNIGVCVSFQIRAFIYYGKLHIFLMKSFLQDTQMHIT